MWRIAALVARAPTKSTGVVLARTGTRCNRGFSAILSVVGDSHKQQQHQQSQRYDSKRRIRDRSKGSVVNNNTATNHRSFHASSSIGFKRSWGPGDTNNDSNNETDNADNNNNNDFDIDPDFLDDDDLLYNREQGDEGYYDDDGEEERERYRLQQETVNNELDNRRGRPWTDPWEIKEEQWFSADTSSENLPDWSPNFVSRISLEKLQVLPNEDGGGIPTLQEIAELSLPVSDPLLHPARKTKTYASFRKSQNYKEVRACVEKLAKNRVAALLKKAAEASKGGNNDGGGGGDSDDWTNLQDSVDALFEALQEEAKADPSMDVLSFHPSFPSWVDRGLEEVLRDAENEAAVSGSGEKVDEPNDAPTTESDAETETETETETVATTNEANDKTDSDSGSSRQEFSAETPVFMDCYDPSEANPDGGSPGPMVPRILHPLAPHRHGGPGRMVEEWELSAHSTTKRIMLRECTQTAAKILSSDENASPKIYVYGKQGVGKSALLASVVATARISGHIVMYLPDGDRLRKNGFYITPSTHPDHAGMFDLPNLSLEVLQQLVESHDAAEQMEGMVADRSTLQLYFKDTQFKRLDDYRKGLPTSDGDGDDGSISLLDLIEYAQGHMKHAPMVYSVVVNRLMHQTEKKFMIVMDEFNCLFDRGHYYHMAYDEDVKDPIPYDKISLFEPIMEAMNLSTKTVEEEEDSGESSETAFATSNVSVVVGTSEAHAIKSSVTSLLTECAERRTNVETIEVPPFSSLEADHVLANFEATGVGKLRLDRGDTLMNPQEMEYLKMVSGSIGQKLLDVSIL